MERGIQEFKVCDAKTNKEIYLRVVFIDTKPTIQLKISVKTSNVTEIDISSASKVFIPISDDNQLRFKILLKIEKDNISLYSKERKIFEDCVKAINKILEQYHKNQNRMVTELGYPIMEYESSRPLSTVRNSIVEDENAYITMVNAHSPEKSEKPVPSSDTSSDVNDTQSQIINAKASIEYYENMAFESEYNVPQFNINDKPYSFSSKNFPAGFKDLYINIRNSVLMKEEILCSGGIELKVNPQQCLNIKVVEIDNFLWIKKIMGKDECVSKLHVGDKIYTVNQKPITKEIEFCELCKNTTNILRIQRLPQAKIFAVRNEVLKDSCKKDLTFINSDMKIDKGKKGRWIITEVNNMTDIDSNKIDIITKSDTPFHIVILHKKSFMSKMNTRRKSVFSTK